MVLEDARIIKAVKMVGNGGKGIAEKYGGREHS